MVVGPKLYSLRESLWPPRDSYVYELKYNYREESAALLRMKLPLSRLASIAQTRGSCLVLLIHPQLVTLGFLHPLTEIYDLVAELGRERGFVIAPSYDYFAGLDERELWILPYDHHPNAAGHEILSRALLDTLETLPAECWQRRDDQPRS